MKKVVIAGLFFVYFIFLSTAYSGVSPGIYTMDFEPGVDRVFTFTFLGDVDSSYEVYADGDLAKYATLSVNELSGGGAVSVLLELPNSLEPGGHVLLIGAREAGSASGISVTANIQGQIAVNVPYPGKYAKLYFTTSDANAGEDVQMNILLDNLGVEEVNFEGKIRISDERGKFLEDIDLGEYRISTLHKENINYPFDTKPYPSGKYKAEAIFEYESGILTDTKPFRLGKLYVNIVDATKKLSRDTINQFNIVVESQWNDPIENVYAEVNVFGEGFKFTTPSINLQGFQTANLTGFFDTSGITDDSFNVNVRVFYQGSYSEKFVKLTFDDKVNYLLIAGICAGVIFIIVLIILIVITIKLRRIKYEIGKRKKR